ncbi:1-phosphofructokinase family hexose kinase [Salegentibacter sp. F188]|uniref:1-phosphofructokinase family hexose kinase n=1 Tax=Autumnicola patrickiae TaxID=3075591 RepID=A0ABU3E578_9FLAO|nr:1-phosphofructokinase family hexose kinase [Salegentibacter sp. F188]MDT0691097.1 1-phosphofructokinase family hexose kinase [Salegentibacter sp. F188]
MKKIVTLTANPALDIYSTVEKVEPEVKMRSESPKKDPGGGGINISRVLHRLDQENKAIYTSGGFTGDIFAQLLDEEHINHEPFAVKNDMRQNFGVFENSTGELYRFGFPGAEMEESEAAGLLDKLEENLEDAEFLVASGSLPPGISTDFYGRVAKLAQKKNVKFILDSSGKALAEGLKHGAYLVKPNLDELQDLTGQKAETAEQRKEMLKKILEDYPVEVVVHSLGPDGAFLATKKEIKHFPAPKVKINSSIGAGDSMVAGIVYSLANNKSLEEAVLFGLACGSATLISPGTELLKKEDVERLYKQLLDNHKDA